MPDTEWPHNLDLTLAHEYAIGYVEGLSTGNDEELYPEDISEAVRWARRQGYDAGVREYCETIGMDNT